MAASGSCPLRRPRTALVEVNVAVRAERNARSVLRPGLSYGPYWTNGSDIKAVTLEDLPLALYVTVVFDCLVHLELVPSRRAQSHRSPLPWRAARVPLREGPPIGR